jgi:hypothetical protein
VHRGEPGAEPGAGLVFGPFVTVRSLPGSNFGDVYMAALAGPDGPAVGEGDVFLKVARPFQANDAILRERFNREAIRYAQIRHDRVVGFIDSGEQNGLPWIAHQLLPGESLASRVARVGRLTGPRLIRTLAEILDGLDAMRTHSSSIGTCTPATCSPPSRRGHPRPWIFSCRERSVADPAHGGDRQRMVRRTGATWWTPHVGDGGRRRLRLGGHGRIRSDSGTSAQTRHQGLVDQGVPRDLAKVLSPCLSEDSSLRPLKTRLIAQLRELEEVWAGRDSEGADRTYPAVLRAIRWEQGGDGRLRPSVEFEPFYAHHRVVRAAPIDARLLVPNGLAIGQAVTLRWRG